MHKDIEIKLTPICSPICQILIHESVQDQLDETKRAMLEHCTELLVIRLESTVIGYATLEKGDCEKLILKSTHYRSIIKDHMIGEYGISRILTRYLENQDSESFLLAS